MTRMLEQSAQVSFFFLSALGRDPSRKDLSLISRMTMGKPDHRLQSILGGRLQAHNDFRALCAQGGVKACLAL